MKTQNMILIGVGTLLTGIVGYKLIKLRMAAQPAAAPAKTFQQTLQAKWDADNLLYGKGIIPGSPILTIAPKPLPVSNTRIPIDVYDEASQDVVINEPPKSLVRTIISNEQPISNAAPFNPDTTRIGFAKRDFLNDLQPDNTFLAGLKLR